MIVSLLSPLVAHPPNRFDVLTPAGLHELCADFADMLLNHVAVALRVIAPYRLIDAILVKDLVGVRGQKFDDVKFSLGKGKLLLIPKYFSAREIDNQPLGGHNLWRAVIPLVPAQMSLNAGNQFLQAERLGDIVVPSGPQAVDLILFCDSRRQE